MSSLKEFRERKMREALALQSEWEHALAELTNGRGYDELSVEEQSEYCQVSTYYSEHIDELLEAAYPNLKQR